MGWKNVKDYYKIGHIVTVKGDVIHIGSPYIHNLISITKSGIVTRENKGWSVNIDLERYCNEMSDDLEKLKELINTPDKFDNSITIYTYSDGDIIEKQCEKEGWPNVTHDGELMYDNMFFSDKQQAIIRAKGAMNGTIKYTKEYIKECEDKLKETCEQLKKYEDMAAKLELDYPTQLQ